uniref:ORF3 polyprotein n=1 Tax=Spiraea yellow leafspot virus TaxID=157271 RepID=A0A8E7IL10_9VIRU|nr:ORF3 polyprotein [Spiraea yellow leafspot virus]
MQPSRSRTVLQPPPATERINRSDDRSPTIEDQIRGYQRMQRARHNARRALQRTFSGRFRNTLEQQLNPDAELALSRRRRANLVPAEVLYTYNGDEPVNRVYQHYEERSAHIVDRQMDFRFIEEESYRTLVREGLQFIHLGMAMVRIHMLHRTDAGISAMVVFRDTRWTDDRAVLASMSVDMTRGSQLVYMIPDVILSIHDFYNHIQVSVQTRGYGQGWTGGDSNMIITRSLIARLTNQSTTNFGYRIGGVMDYLASNGVSCIPGQAWNVTNRDARWTLQRSTITAAEQAPTEAHLRTEADGSISMRFGNFRDQTVREEEQPAEEDGRPEPSSDTHYILMWRHTLDGQRQPQQQELSEVVEPDLLSSWMAQLSTSPERQRPKTNSRWPKEEGWDTLGQPSGKYDHMVKYTPPPPTPFPTNPTGWEIEEEPKAGSEDDHPGPKFDSTSNFSEGGEEALEIPEDCSFDAKSEESYNHRTWREEDAKHEALIEQGYTTVVGFPGMYVPAQQPDEQEEAYQAEPELEDDLDYPQIMAASTVEQEAEISLEYPQKFHDLMNKLKKFQTETVAVKMDTSETGFIPPNPTQGPVGYAPATGTHGTNIGPSSLEGWSGQLPRSRMPQGYGRPQQPWHLPSAQSEQGAMLIMPEDLTLAPDVINRWESITINLINKMSFESLRDKVDFVENLLGEREKEAWISWRMRFEAEYQQLVAVSDDIRNLTAAIKRIFGVHDPFTGSTHLQNQAYADLERLSCKKLDDIMPFLHTYYQLAARSGRMWANSELSEKLFRKLPESVGTVMEKSYRERYPGLEVGVMARINFIIEYLQNVCKQAELQRSLKNLSFCSKMPVPGYYDKYDRKKYGVRKSKTYKGKPHDTHVKVIKNKNKGAPGKKCKCYLCGIEGHYARECPRKVVKPERLNFFEGLSLADNWDVLSVDVGESDDEDVCSISEGETAGRMDELAAFKAQLPYPVEFEQTMLAIVQEAVQQATDTSWRRKLELKQEQKNCQHQWSDTVEVPEPERRCSICSDETPAGRRVHCIDCRTNLCPLCAYMDYGIKIIATKTDATKWRYLNKDDLIKSLYDHNAFLVQKTEALQKRIKELEDTTIGEKLQEDLINMAEQRPDLMEALVTELSKPFDEGSSKRPGKEEVWPTAKIRPIPPSTFRGNTTLRIREIPYNQEANWEDSDIGEEFVGALLAEGELQALAAACDTAYTEMPRGGLNKLYNLVIKFVIPQEKGNPITFSVNAVLDTGCTCCCVNKKKVPEAAMEETTTPMTFAGINSRGSTKWKMKTGKMIIGDNDFLTPYISVFDMGLPDVDMLLGCNFIRAMKGGLRLEGTEVTIYKKVTTLKTTLEPQKLGFAEVDLDIQLEMDRIYYSSPITEDGLHKLRNHRLLEELKQQGFIGDDPMKHWAKNQIRCKLEIINPDITIQGKPPSTVTPEEKARYQRHIDALLQIGVIRPSKSRHRTAAFITYSGTSVDPVTKKETRGKERLVFDYRALNANTHKDQYTLPGINSIVSAIGNAKIFSKFDLKAGFHQVLMDEQSIPWTAFITPVGFYEWLVMPFGIANAPAIFQRKMDNCFNRCKEFIAVYIDDILVFSNTLQEHEKHLQKMLEICRANGLVLSPTKMKVAVTEVDFLGATIGAGSIKLQSHVIKKIAEVDDESLKTLKGLRSWLGVLNYARNYIPKCGTLLGPLYSKTGEHGDRRMSPSDWKLVKQVKQLVSNLPDLKLPSTDAYIIIECDGCMEGWGGICKWRPKKGDSAAAEEICGYASGKFPTIKSTIDAEMHAVMNSLEKFQIFYMSKGEVTIRTDCQAIISFYEKLNANKPSRVRWLSFCDYITNTGVQVKFEHIKGKNNQIADTLSRLAQTLAYTRWLPEEQNEVLHQALNAPELQQHHRQEILGFLCEQSEKFRHQQKQQADTGPSTLYLAALATPKSLEQKQPSSEETGTEGLAEEYKTSYSPPQKMKRNSAASEQEFTVTGYHWQKQEGRPPENYGPPTFDSWTWSSTRKARPATWTFDFYGSVQEAQAQNPKLEESVSAYESRQDRHGLRQ